MKHRQKISTYNKISKSAHIKIEPFDVNKRYTKPHRHNKYLELVYFREGSGFHYMDLKSYPIKPPVVFIINRDEVHHWQIDTVPNGFVIILKEDFLKDTLDKKINSLLQQLSKNQVVNIPINANINSLFELLYIEVKENRSGQNDIVEGALKVLFAKIIRYADMDKTLPLNDRLSMFNTLLGQELKNDVSHYARLLNTTAQNLNSLCKMEYSTTASQVIAVHIIKEAKRSLRFTDLSVTEIAYEFDFKDVSHFVKYFKRHEGKTPMQFRKLE